LATITLRLTIIRKFPASVGLLIRTAQFGRFLQKNRYTNGEENVVGNLSFHTTESDIRTAFEQFGPVESVAIITDRETGRSKGFGFVEMSEDDANKAIAD
jgi:hypothetical protein